MNVLFKNKLITLLIFAVCCALILFWIIASTLLINKISFSVISATTQNQINYNGNTFQLRTGQNYQGKFIAKDNNLGLIIISFEAKHIVKPSGSLVFKFKKASSKKWDFSHTYNLSLFDSQTSFSFGVPIISESTAKNYTFELSLENVRSADYLIVKNPNIFIAGYKYSKSQIFGTKSALIHFIINKVSSSFSDYDFVVNSLIFLTPLGLFLVFIILLKKALRLNKKLLTVKNLKFGQRYLKYLLLIFIIAELSFPQILQLPSSYILTILWFITFALFKFKSTTSFIISIALLVFWIFIIPFGLNNLQESLNVLVYFSFATGVVQLLIEQGREK